MIKKPKWTSRIDFYLCRWCYTNCGKLLDYKCNYL